MESQPQNPELRNNLKNINLSILSPFLAWFLKLDEILEINFQFCPIHDLTPETQLLAAIGYGTYFNFICIRDQLHIIFDRKNCELCFSERVCDAKVKWEKELNMCSAHPLTKIYYKIKN